MKLNKLIESAGKCHSPISDFIASVQQTQSTFQRLLCAKSINRIDDIEYKIQSLALGQLIKVFFLLNEGLSLPKLATFFYNYFDALGGKPFDKELNKIPDPLQVCLNEISGNLLSLVRNYCGYDEIYKSEFGPVVLCPKQRCYFWALNRFAGLNSLQLVWITVDFSEQVAKQLIINANRDIALQQKIQNILNTALGKDSFAGFGVIEAANNGDKDQGLHCHIILAMNPDKLSSLRIALKVLVDNAEKTAICIKLERKCRVTVTFGKPTVLSVKGLPIDVGAADYITKGLPGGKKIYNAKRALIFNPTLFADKHVMAGGRRVFELCIERLKYCLNLPGCTDAIAFVSEQILSMFYKQYCKFSNA